MGRDRSGATAIEYVLIASLISVVIVGSARAVGSDVQGFFNLVRDGFPK